METLFLRHLPGFGSWPYQGNTTCLILIGNHFPAPVHNVNWTRKMYAMWSASSWWCYAIEMLSTSLGVYERNPPVTWKCGISHCQQLGCLFNSMFRLTAMKTPKFLYYCPFVREIYQVLYKEHNKSISYLSDVNLKCPRLQLSWCWSQKPSCHSTHHNTCQLHNNHPCANLQHLKPYNSWQTKLLCIFRWIAPDL